MTFQFWARDYYHSPKPLNLSIAQNNPDLVIIAYEEDGAPLFEKGPLRSVIDQSIMPDGEYSSQYSVQMLSEITINALRDRIRELEGELARMQARIDDEIARREAEVYGDAH